jgi:hypothetical protein
VGTAAALVVALSYAGAARAAGGDLPPILSPPPPQTAQPIVPPPPPAAPAVAPSSTTESETRPAPPPDVPLELHGVLVPTREVSAAPPAFMRLRGWRVSFDVRGEIHSLFKIYGGGADGGGGGGVAADFEVARYVAPDPRSSIWGGVALGAGLALHYDAWVIGGIDPGVLGARGVQSGVTSFFEVEPSVFLGGRLGIGSFTGPSAWRGVILGATWAPTYVYFTGTDRFGGAGTMHPAGIRLTADIGSLDGAREGREAIFRLTLTWLPHVNDLPTILTLGGGAAFY